MQDGFGAQDKLGVGAVPPAGGATSPLTTKGDVWAYSSVNARLPVGTDGQVLSADSTAGTGLRWIDSPAGSSPLTTKGDIFTHSTVDARLPAGVDGQILSADSTAATGLKWITSGGSATVSGPPATAQLAFWTSSSDLTGVPEIYIQQYPAFGPLFGASDGYGIFIDPHSNVGLSVGSGASNTATPILMIQNGQGQISYSVAGAPDIPFVGISYGDGFIASFRNFAIGSPSFTTPGLLFLGGGFFPEIHFPALATFFQDLQYTTATIADGGGTPVTTGSTGGGGPTTAAQFGWRKEVHNGVNSWVPVWH